MPANPMAPEPAALNAAAIAKREQEEVDRQKALEAAKPVEPAPEKPADSDGYDLKPGEQTKQPSPTPEPKTEEPKVEAKPEDDELSDVPDIPAAENFKRLRTKTKELSRTLKQIQDEKSALEREVEGFKTGSVFPEVLVEKQNRIDELEHYEKIHSLKTSKEYQDTYVKPLSMMHSRLNEMAAEYDIPKEELDRAINLGSNRELNQFLSEHFDDVGALEAKQLINQAKGLQTAAQEAEKEPAKALDNLIAEHARIEEFRENERRTKIVDTSRDTWRESLFDIKAEGILKEIIWDDNNPEHNDKFVKPILSQAATEYGKLVKALANNGLRELPRDLGKALASMVARAHASAVSGVIRDAAIKAHDELEENTRRTNHMVRPQIGSVGADSAAPGPRTPSTPSSAAEKALKKIGL